MIYCIVRDTIPLCGSFTAARSPKKKKKNSIRDGLYNIILYAFYYIIIIILRSSIVRNNFVPPTTDRTRLLFYTTVWWLCIYFWRAWQSVKKYKSKNPKRWPLFVCVIRAPIAFDTNVYIFVVRTSVCSVASNLKCGLPPEYILKSLL